MKVLLFMLLGLAVAGGAWSQPYEALEHIDRLVDLSGIVMVVDTGEVVYQKSFGFADHQSKKAIDEHTLFPLASLTKPFTAMAIGILQEQGRLNLDDPIAEYLVQFASNPTLTIRHLVEHRSGLIRDLTDQRVISPYELIELEDLVDAIAKAPMRSKAGSTYQYSNANYQVLA
ncbi:MAG: serine hydrolase domain-containing protein, partial [Sphaerochaeta sp.]